jgi:hypothetical protein
VCQFEISAYKLVKDIGIPQTRVSGIVKAIEELPIVPLR